MANIGWLELLIIVALITFLVLVPRRLPGLARSLGKSIRSFKRGLKEGKQEAKTTLAEVKEAAGVDEVKSTVAEIRDSTSIKGVVPGKKRSTATSAGTAAKKKTK